MRRLRITLGIAGLACALAAPAGARAALELESGPLRVSVGEQPFALTFSDRSDGDRLRTRAIAGSPEDPRGRYGPLGYSFDLRVPAVNNAYLGYYVAAEVPTVWFHATRVLSSRREGDALVLETATNDPLGHRLEVTLAPAREGVVSVESRMVPGSGPLAGHATVSGAAFEHGGGERYLGFGERSNAVDQTGKKVFSWAEEGPFSSGDYERFTESIPDFTFPTGPTATNFPIPWLVSTRGLGFLIDQTERSTFNLANERRDSWHAEAESSRFRFKVYAGPGPAQVLKRYSADAGRQPWPAAWVFGPWFQPTLEPSQFQLADRFRAEDVPVSVAQTYTHYLPCGDQVGRRAGERERTAGFHARGYKVTTYFNPHVCASYQPVYEEARSRGLLVKNGLGLPYLLSNPFTADEVVSEIDFTAPGAAEFFHGLLGEAIDDGFDGWMEDFGEYTPTDSVFANGEGGLRMHNRYPVIYHAASTEYTQRRRGRDFATFIRSGFHGVQPHARVVWGGDPTEDWSCSDGLCAAVHQALSMGLSGVAYWGSDIGGFHAIVNGRTSDELNIRWLQFGAASGVMRTQANGFSFRDDRARRSQVWSPEVLPIWRRYAKLRTQLYPYLAAASARYQRTGLPLTRALALTHPDDERAVRSQEEYMLGSDLLVAPVIKPGARERELYLPRGTWIDFWRAVSYQPGDGSLRLDRAARAAPVTGGRELTLSAPLEELPLLVRAGAVLPLLPADVDTLADVGSGDGLVKLADRERKLVLLAFPRGTSLARLSESERLRSFESRRGRKWTLRVAGRRERTYSLQATLATLRRPFRPCSVELGGRKLRRAKWRYSTRTRVLRVRFKARSKSLVVRGCR